MKRVLTALVVVLLPVAALAGSELPVENGVVTSGIGWRPDPFGSGKLLFHRGIDIAVPSGTPVHSVRKGRVIFAGTRSGYGLTVIIEHVNGDRTLYGHNSSLRVKPGEVVESGAVVALSGNSGRSTGPHVHFELLASGKPNEEPKEKDEAVIPQVAHAIGQREALEKLMDQSVNSILKTIRSQGIDQGG